MEAGTSGRKKEGVPASELVSPSPTVKCHILGPPVLLHCSPRFCMQLSYVLLSRHLSLQSHKLCKDGARDKRHLRHTNSGRRMKEDKKPKAWSLKTLPFQTTWTPYSLLSACDLLLMGQKMKFPGILHTNMLNWINL